MVERFTGRARSRMREGWEPIESCEGRNDVLRRSTNRRQKISGPEKKQRPQARRQVRHPYLVHSTPID